MAAFNPVAAKNAVLFNALLIGKFVLDGFSNHFLLDKLFNSKPKDAAESKRGIHRFTLLIAKLRGHRLISKVQNSGRYRVSHHADTPCGLTFACLMLTSLPL